VERVVNDETYPLFTAQDCCAEMKKIWAVWTFFLLEIVTMSVGSGMPRGDARLQMIAR
jgi:uncharacterized RDD family membrane protein YckC